MDDLDLRDTRGRLRRLGVSAAFAFVATVGAIHEIDAWSRPANADPVGASAVPLLAIAMFVVLTAAVSAVLPRRH